MDHGELHSIIVPSHLYSPTHGLILGSYKKNILEISPKKFQLYGNKVRLKQRVVTSLLSQCRYRVLSH